MCLCAFLFNTWNLSFLIQLANIMERFKVFLSLYLILSVYEVNSFGWNFRSGYNYFNKCEGDLNISVYAM